MTYVHVHHAISQPNVVKKKSKRHASHADHDADRLLLKNAPYTPRRRRSIFSLTSVPAGTTTRTSFAWLQHALSLPGLRHCPIAPSTARPCGKRGVSHARRIQSDAPRSHPRASPMLRPNRRSISSMCACRCPQTRPCEAPERPSERRRQAPMLNTRRPCIVQRSPNPAKIVPWNCAGSHARIVSAILMPPQACAK